MTTKRSSEYAPVLTPPPDAEIMEWPTFTMYADEEGIYYAISKPAPPRTLELQKNLIHEIKGNLPEEKICILIDVTHSPPAPREVREYMTREFPKFFKAVAMISRSPLGKMAANLFFTIKSQPYPTKFFNKEVDAVKWLRQYL